MKVRAKWAAAGATAIVLATASLLVHADPQALERARASMASGNARQAFTELSALQDRLTGQPEFDYLLGVAALDSGRIDEAIIAFERVLAMMPNHAGAQMDLARAYYTAGSYDLAEAAFIKLRAARPPAGAQQAIERYLAAIEARRNQTRPGWAGFAELGLGYDSNLTGVPTDFGAAAQQAFNLTGIEATGNSIKRSAPFVQGAFGAEYSRPLSAGWSLFAGGEARARAYRRESDFNSRGGDLRLGAARNSGPDQYRATASYFHFDQEGDAPGEPQPTNDRRMGGLGFDWRHSLDQKAQFGLGLQVNRVRFPRNEIEDFDQLFVSASWLRSFDRAGVPLLYLSVFGSEDRARNTFAGGEADKSKRVGGVRSYLQYSVSPRLQVYNGLAAIHRRDRDAFARSTQVEKGRDTYGEATLGLAWQFRERCALRLQYAYSLNRSNIDIYDFDRHEFTSSVRCELF